MENTILYFYIHYLNSYFAHWIHNYLQFAISSDMDRETDSSTLQSDIQNCTKYEDQSLVIK